jgi:hypothetical protein
MKRGSGIEPRGAPSPHSRIAEQEGGPAAEMLNGDGAAKGDSALGECS